MERKRITLDGKSYMAEQVADDEKQDSRNYIYVKGRSGRLWKIPHIDRDVRNNPSAFPVADRYWHQDFECYEDDEGQYAYRALGRPRDAQMTDFPEVIENRRLYTDFINKLRLSDDQRWTAASNGSSGPESEGFFPHSQRSGRGMSGPGVGQAGTDSSSDPYILLGNVSSILETRLGPMYVYGRVGTAGEVYDLFLRPVPFSEPFARTGSRGPSGPLVPMAIREASRTDLDIKGPRFARTVIKALKMSAGEGLTTFVRGVSVFDPIPEITTDSIPEKKSSSLATDRKKIEAFHRDFAAQLKRTSSGGTVCRSSPP